MESILSCRHLSRYLAVQDLITFIPKAEVPEGFEVGAPAKQMTREVRTRRSKTPKLNIWPEQPQKWTNVANLKVGIPTCMDNGDANTFACCMSKS